MQKLKMTFAGLFIFLLIGTSAHSQLILRDTLIKPGNDFYKYVNADWLNTSKIPDDLPAWGGFTTLAVENQLKLKGILEELAAKNNLPKGSMEQKVADLYASGMDTATINHLSFKPLIPVLNKIDAVKDYHELLLLIANLYKEGNGQLFGFNVAADFKNSNINIVNFMQAGTTLPEKSYYLNKDETSKFIRSKLKSFIQQMFILNATPQNEAEIKAEKIVALETQIAISHLSNVELRDPNNNYHKMSLSEFQKLTPHIVWNELFQIMGVHTDSFNIAHPAYFKTLDSLLISIPIETWKDKTKYVYINTKSALLSQPFQDASFAFNQIFTGQIKQQERWKKMVSISDGELLGKLYVKKYFTSQAKAKMDTLVNNLLAAFKLRLEKLDWMSDSTKKEALLKLSRITKKIGYPEKIKNYDDVVISRTDFFANNENYLLYAYKESISKINKAVDKSEWVMTTPTVNAYYNPANNEIVFPAGILQPPFFYVNGNDASNYGAIGMVISHEITHGFDDQGRQFDANGNLRDWWTKEDAEKFDDRKKLLIEQYSQFKIFDSIPVNGQLTIGENIADQGGIAIAYDAFKMTQKGKKTNKNEEVKADQIFFKSFATIWSSKARDNFAAMLIKMDTHSPDKFRVNGTLSNFTPFYKTYQLTTENSMYRMESDRVKIW